MRMTRSTEPEKTDAAPRGDDGRRAPLVHKGVIITGAGAGLGRAYALACAAAGAGVVVNDIAPEAAADTAAAIRAAGGEVVAAAGSVASWEVAEELTRLCAEHFGRVDGLVANAGIMRTGAPWELDEATLRSVVEVNVLGVQFTARHALRAMVEDGGGGSVVTVVSGAQHGIPAMSAYGASKGAVNAMTRNWALEGAPHRIRVNAVSPLGRTAMSALDLRDERPDLPDPAHVAPLVVALLSDEAAGVSGRVIRFDGRLLGRYETGLHEIAEADAWSADALVRALIADGTEESGRPVRAG